MAQGFKNINDLLKGLGNSALFGKRHKTGYAVIVLFGILYIGLILTPQLNIFFKKWKEGERIKAEIASVQKDWKDINLFKQEVANLNDRIDFYEKMLPEEKDMPAVLAYLSDAAKRLDVRIEEIRPAEAEEKKNKSNLPPSKAASNLPPSKAASFYTEAPIIVKAECGYHQLGRFLSELESSSRLMKIDNFKIVGNPARPNVHYIQVTVVTYMTKK